MRGVDEMKSPASVAEHRDDDHSHGERFRPTFWSALQARRIKLWLTLVGKGLLRFNIEVEGLELVPRGEPLVVAAGPHRNWIDPFLILQALPPPPIPPAIGGGNGYSSNWPAAWCQSPPGGTSIGTDSSWRWGSSSAGTASASFPKGGGQIPSPRSCPSSVASPSSVSIPSAGCSRLLLPVQRTSGVARRYAYGSPRRSTRFRRKPIAMRNRPLSIVCARYCKTRYHWSRKSNWKGRNLGDGGR